MKGVEQANANVSVTVTLDRHQLCEMIRAIWESLPSQKAALSFRPEVPIKISEPAASSGEVVRYANATQNLGMLVDVKTVSKLLCVSRSTIYSLMQSGKMPPPVRTLGRMVRWRTDDILTWINSECCPPAESG